MEERGGRTENAPSAGLFSITKRMWISLEGERKLEQKSKWGFCKRSCWNEIQEGQRRRNSWDHSGFRCIKKNLSVKKCQKKQGDKKSLLVRASQGQARCLMKEQEYQKKWTVDKRGWRKGEDVAKISEEREKWHLGLCGTWKMTGHQVGCCKTGGSEHPGAGNTRASHGHWALWPPQYKHRLFPFFMCVRLKMHCRCRALSGR